SRSPACPTSAATCADCTLLRLRQHNIPASPQCGGASTALRKPHFERPRRSPPRFRPLRESLTLTLTIILTGGSPMTDQSRVQPQTSTSTNTGILALLTAKPGVTRERVMAIMPAEIRATVQLYLEGKIREWYAREDGRGAIFLLNARDVAEASSIME